MDQREKYAVELKQINGAPEYNKKRAIKRFLLLMDFKDNFFPTQPPDVSPSKAFEMYCSQLGISLRSFYRWQSDYKRHGIKGLLPKYGSNRRPKTRSILSIKKISRGSRKLTATIAIDLKNPLKCLYGIRKIIDQCRFIDPEVKTDSLTRLDRYFKVAFDNHHLSLRVPLTNEEIKGLLRFKNSTHKNYCRKAAVILMANEGKTLRQVIETTHTAERTIYHWLRNFNNNRLDSIKVRMFSAARTAKKAERRARVIDIVHKQPALYGINRTTWTYAAIAAIYEREYGEKLSMGNVQLVMKETGHKWYHIRKVMTSPDPEYIPKVKRVMDALLGLKEGERFFFVDEVGPYRVKRYGGRRLALPGEIETIPEFQKPKGKVQFVAALEALSNQLTWIFTKTKGSEALIALLDRLVREYPFCPKMYLTWDAIGVHSSKALTTWIMGHNQQAKAPIIEVVPLPSKAQFLNVIEAVFGGMKRAVICNSDYGSAREMQEAIARHFEERNQFYKENPKKAGNKIWDSQRFDFDKLAGGLFKKM